MASTIVATPNQLQAWSKKTVNEYVRKSGFEPYMSKGGDGIININLDLKGESKGTIVHCPLIAKLRGQGNDGTTPMVGNEEAITNYSVPIRTAQIRNAVDLPLNETIKSDIDFVNEAQPLLRNWLAERLRRDLITALQSVPIAGQGGTNPEDGTKAFTDALAADRNAFMARNQDRVLVGSLESNYNVTMSTALANIDASRDKLTSAMLDVAKMQARETTSNGSDWAIEPYVTDDGNEYYVVFVDSRGFRDLRNDPDIKEFNLQARPRENGADKNPLMTGGALEWNGIIIREVPEFVRIAGAGVSGVDVGYAALCGKGTVNLAYNFMAQPTKKSEDDYQNTVGIGVREFRGQQKCSVNGLQTSMVSVFHASAPNA